MVVVAGTLGPQSRAEDRGRRLQFDDREQASLRDPSHHTPDGPPRSQSGSRDRSSLAGMEDEVIRALVTRLARPHRSGGEVIERAAIFANGADFAEVMAWITARGGTAEAVVSTARGGLHDQHLDARTAAVAPTPRRFVLPPGALTR